MRRRHVLAVAALTLAPLAACSVPREADLARATPSASTATPSATTPVPTPTPSATPTPTPTPTPEPAPAKPPTPTAVPGYTLKAAPRAIGDPLEAVRGAGDLFGALTVKSVAKGDTYVGLLFLFAERPQAAGNPKISAMVLDKVVAGVTGRGIPVKMQRFGRQRVAVGTSPKNGTIVLWCDADVLHVVVGTQPAGVTDYARAYVARR